MHQNVKKKKAIAMMSGGLDSALAARLVKDQGIEVVGLHYLSPFGCSEDVKKVAEGVGVPLILRDKGEAFIDLVENPKYGYGKNMNPCIDCRIFTFQLADKVREEEGADFIVTGEVLGQRPMSQLRHSMEIIDRKSAIEDRVVRPLSAHHFEPSLPEREGWLDRSKLLGISGRGRKEQLALAKELNITFFASPAGGCLLTDAGFSKRLKDFFDHKTHTDSEERLAQAEMIRLGRHFRFSETAKTILARNNEENKELRRLWPKAKGTLIAPKNFPGPVAVFFGPPAEAPVTMTAQLIARYGKKTEASRFEFTVETLEGPTTPLAFAEVTDPQSLEQYRL